MVARRALLLVWFLLWWVPLYPISWVPFWEAAVRASVDPLPGWEETTGDTHREVTRETASVSQELSIQSERQSKKVCLLIRRPDAKLRDQDRPLRVLSSALLIPHPLQFFFPRKLSPPTSAADPDVPSVS